MMTEEYINQQTDVKGAPQSLLIFAITRSRPQSLYLKIDPAYAGIWRSFENKRRLLRPRWKPSKVQYDVRTLQLIIL
jgi:hypothetical protein